MARPASAPSFGDGDENDPSSSPLSRAFACSSLTLAPPTATASAVPSSATGAEEDDDGVHTAFYRDRSGRTKLLAMLRLALATTTGSGEGDPDRDAEGGSGDVSAEEELWGVVRSQLAATKDGEPGGDEKKDDGEPDGEKKDDEPDGDGSAGRDDEGEQQSSAPTTSGGCMHSIRFECRSNDGMLIVEGVNLLDARRGGERGEGGGGGMEFDVEIVARAAAPSSSPYPTSAGGNNESARPPPPPSGPPPPSSATSGGLGGGGADAFDASLPNVVESALSIRAVLLSQRLSDEAGGRKKRGEDEEKVDENEHLGGDYGDGGEDRFCRDVSLGLLALELGGGLSPYSDEVGDPRQFSTGSAEEGGHAGGASDADAADVNDNEIEEHYGTTMTYAPKTVVYRVRLVSPALVSCKSVGGARAAHGATLVSLTVSHSNVHPHPVAITNVALHPGHSRLYVSRRQRQKQQRERDQRQQQQQSSGDDELAAAASAAERACVGRGGLSMMGGSSPASAGGDDGRNAGGDPARDESASVIDMSKHVRWGYAVGAHAPELPYVLRPHEALSTVLSVDAGEDLRSRTFVSPVAVTVVVCDGDGEETDDDDDDGNAITGREDDGEGGGGHSPRGKSCVIATDARWTTDRVALVPADAFRVDMSLRDSRYKVGAPLVVGLRVMNLSNEDRNLMLLMAKDEQQAMPAQSSSAPSTPTKSGGKGGGGGGAAGGVGGGNLASALYGKIGGNRTTVASHHHAINTAVVSEVNGYTFGVWGLSGEDDGTARQNRDHELLAVDAALLLGEVKGQHSVEAELRFVPLREGTLDVPNLKLYDKTHGKWYSCVHCLKIVAES